MTVSHCGERAAVCVLCGSFKNLYLFQENVYVNKSSAACLRIGSPFSTVVLSLKLLY